MLEAFERRNCHKNELNNLIEKFAGVFGGHRIFTTKHLLSVLEKRTDVRVIHKVTLSSPCLSASFHPLCPLSVVSAK
jgi:hypothetical protein